MPVVRSARRRSRHVFMPAVTGVAWLASPETAAAQKGVVEPGALHAKVQPHGPITADKAALDKVFPTQPAAIDVDITGQGSVTVDGKTCTSKAGQSAVGCTLQITAGQGVTGRAASASVSAPPSGAWRHQPRPGAPAPEYDRRMEA